MPIAIIALLLINRALGNARQTIRREQEPNVLKLPMPMVQCAYCGIHLPASEAVHYQDKTWCSLEHAQEAEKADYMPYK